MKRHDQNPLQKLASEDEYLIPSSEVPRPTPAPPNAEDALFDVMSMLVLRNIAADLGVEAAAMGWGWLNWNCCEDPSNDVGVALVLVNPLELE
jgi:hypothetical protein